MTSGQGDSVQTAYGIDLWGRMLLAKDNHVSGHDQSSLSGFGISSPSLTNFCRDNTATGFATLIDYCTGSQNLTYP